MSEQNPYEQLGVTREASFEEIQEAKSRLAQKYQEDSKLVQNIEAAYDAIIMDRLKMRQEGKIKVPERIRFPEKEKVVESPPSFNQVATEGSPNWLQRLIDNPSREDVLWPAAVFLGLGGLVVLASGANASLLSLAMALGFGANIYFLNRKEQRFGRAVLLTLVGLLIGVGLGTMLANVTQTTLNSISVSVEQFATLVTCFFFWLISSFLR